MLTHIRMQHLVLASITIDFNTSHVESYESVAVLCGSTLDQILHSNVIEPETRFCTLICANQSQNDTVRCGSPYI